MKKIVKKSCNCVKKWPQKKGIAHRGRFCTKIFPIKCILKVSLRKAVSTKMARKMG